MKLCKDLALKALKQERQHQFELAEESYVQALGAAITAKNKAIKSLCENRYAYVRQWCK